MLKPLNRNFSFERYGLSVRLATEEDTEFILSLRSNKELTKFFHQTDNDVQKHLSWFREYKKREDEARDYYFIYFKDNIPVGVNRIYNIFEYYGTIGSWICCPDNEPETSLSTYFLMLDILFEVLDLDLSVFDVRKKNKHVWKLHKKVGAVQIGESDIDYYFSLNKQDYLSHRNQLLSIFNIVK